MNDRKDFGPYKKKIESKRFRFDRRAQKCVRVKVKIVDRLIEWYFDSETFSQIAVENSIRSCLKGEKNLIEALFGRIVWRIVYWCATNKRKKTKRFVLVWLAKSCTKHQINDPRRRNRSSRIATWWYQRNNIRFCHHELLQSQQTSCESILWVLFDCLSLYLSLCLVTVIWFGGFFLFLSRRWRNDQFDIDIEATYGSRHMHVDQKLIEWKPEMHTTKLDEITESLNFGVGGSCLMWQKMFGQKRASFFPSSSRIEMY